MNYISNNQEHNKIYNIQFIYIIAKKQVGDVI